MKKKILWITTLILFLLSAAFTYAVLCYDVQAIGPEGTRVGFATLNGAFRDRIGVSLFWKDLTDILGALDLATIGVFGFFGLFTWIRVKKLWLVPWEILSMGIVFVLTGLLYLAFVFELVTVNCRPVILSAAEGLEQSFPSSHTMMAVVVMIPALASMRHYLKNSTLCGFLRLLALVLLVTVPLGRLLSGVHWLTDILAGLLYGLFFASLFFSLRSLCSGEKTHNGYPVI